MPKLQLQFMQPGVRPLTIRDFHHQLFVCVRQLGSPLGYPMLKGFVETLEVEFRLLLRSEIAADGCDVHRAAVSRVVDPKPIHQERYLSPCLEMPKVEFADPTAFLHDDRPTIVAR